MEDSMTKQETQSRFLSWLSGAPNAQQNCLTTLQFSDAYNNPGQAQKSKMVPTVEFNKDGIRWDYDMPTVNRFNNKIKK